MGKFKMQFVHPSTESEFIEWLFSSVDKSRAWKRKMKRINKLNR